MIPNIYYLVYHKIAEDIDPLAFFGIQSILELNKPEIIYFYYDYLPNGKLWKKIENKLILKKIIIPKKFINNEIEFFNIYKFAFIYKEIYNNGGIYMDIYSICIKPIHNLLENTFLKSENNEIIMSVKEDPICKNYYDYYVNNIPLDLSNLTIKSNILDLNYSNNLKDIIFNQIYDFSYGNYFYLLYNCYFITLEYNNNITIYDIFNKISIYNLLVRNALTYRLYFKEIIFIDNFNLINNIDFIYWINLEKSIDRRDNMIKLLNLINIPNERFIGIDGSLEDNICNKYFQSNNNIFPKFSNNEYAILLSHLNCIENYINYIENNNLKFEVAMICEDDISFDFINYWKKDIKSIIEEAPNDWEIIMLGYFSLNINRPELYQKWNNEWSAICYLINGKLSSKLKSLKKENKWLCNELDIMVSDNYIFSKFNTYIYKYPYITFPNENDSTFHSDHLDYHRLYKTCNYMVLENIYNEYINNN